MKYLFFIAAFQSLFFAFLLLQKKPKAMHDIILTGLLIYLGLFIGVYAIYSHELFTEFHSLSVHLLSLLMLFGPFIFYYIVAMVNPRKKIRANAVIHLLPFLLFTIYILIASISPELSPRLDMEKISPGNHPPLLFVFFLILTAFSGPFYFFLILREFRKTEINIFNVFSNVTGMDLFWIRRVYLAFGIVWSALILITIVHHIFGLFSTAFCTDGLFLSLSVFVILTGYFGLKQKVIYPAEALLSDEPTGKVKNKYSGSRLTLKDSEHYAQAVRNYLETTKAYQNPDLSLPQLAEGTEIPSHILSQVINEQFGLNFFDFINQYRVNEFKEKIRNPEFSHFSLLGIAFECGFNSKSAFNRVFKKLTGITPTEFKSQV
jgi:AraC-like DNA-binding protein